jgi:hypothetical protein
MRLRRIALATGAAVALAASSFVAAPAASAATRVVTIEVDCTSSELWSTPNIHVTASPGDTIQLVGDPNCTWGDWRNGDPITDALVIDSTDFHAPPPYQWTIRPDAELGTYGSPDGSDNYVFSALAESSIYIGQSFYLTLVKASDRGPIPDWVQGYGRAIADEVCLEGWTPSYDMWPNEGTGGWVCTRNVPMYGNE